MRYLMDPAPERSQRRLFRHDGEYPVPALTGASTPRRDCPSQVYRSNHSKMILL